jgi:hypothetical protein
VLKKYDKRTDWQVSYDGIKTSLNHASILYKIYQEITIDEDHKEVAVGLLLLANSYRPIAKLAGRQTSQPRLTRRREWDDLVFSRSKPAVKIIHHF